MAPLSHQSPLGLKIRLKAALHVLCSLVPLILCLVVAASTDPPPPAQDTLAQDYSSMPRGDSLELKHGDSVAKEITAGSTHLYNVRLSPGQYFKVLLVKGDLSLDLTCFGPGGDRIVTFTSHRYEILEGSLVADVAGSYRLEVSTPEKGSGSRSYELRVEQVSTATDRDRINEAALKSYNEAERLRAQGTETSSQEAVDGYAKALASWQAAGNLSGELRASESLADTYFTLSQYAKALSFYQKVLEASKRLGERWREAEALSDVGRIYNYIGHMERAKRYCEKALNLHTQPKHSGADRGETRARAKALNNIGEVYNTLGQLKRAFDSFDRSVSLWVDVGDRRGEAQARLNLGYALADSGYLENALAQYNRAASLWQDVGDERGQALALTALGGVYSFLGQKQSALNAHKAALELFGKVGDKQSQGVAINGIGQAYEDLNENEAALANYKQALEIYHDNGSKSFAAVTECYVARVYHSLGESPQALAHYRNCIALNRELNKRRIEAYALQGITDIYDPAGQKQATRRRYQQMLRLYQSIGDRRGQALVLKNLGRAYSASGDVPKSLAYFKRALPLIQAVADRHEETAIRYNMAEAMRDLGDLDGARSQIEQAIQIIESLRAYVASPALRSSYFASVYKHYGFYIDLLMRLDERHAGEGFAAAALQASESARARSLLEALMKVNEDVRWNVPPELLERKRSLQRLLSAKANYQIRLLSHNQDRAEAAAVEQEIRQLTIEYQEIEGQISQQFPRYASLIQPRPLRIEDIRAELLEDDTLLLEYSLGEKRSYLWAVTRDSLSSYVLPARAEIEKEARDVYALLTARQPLSSEETPAEYQARVSAADRQYEEKSSALSRLLLGPVASRLGAKRLLVVTEGVLQFIPFEALPDPALGEGRAPENAGKPVPLILGHEVINLPSISALAAIRRERTLPPQTRKAVAVFADPVFEAGDPRLRPDIKARPEAEVAGARQTLRVIDFGPEGAAGISRLLYTQQEANAIMEVTPEEDAMLAVGFDANRARAMGPELKDYQVVHFATHSFIDDEHPELSGIMLSVLNADGSPADGFLQLHDIYDLDLSAELVVLSSCRTGLGKDIKGEGIVGLTRGFMYAGSKSVLASLWKVDDRATAELMGNFYQAMLKEGRTPAAAIREAKLKILGQKRWQPPFYWAAFVLQGEYEGKIRVKAPGMQDDPTLSVVTFLLLLLGPYAARRVAAYQRR